MRLTAVLLLVSLGASLPASAADRPRVMSIDNCANQLVLTLADRDQIVSLSNGAEAGILPEVKALGAGLPVNRRTAEEVLAARPDLVFYGTWTGETAATVRRLNIRAIKLDPPRDVEAAKRQIVEVARLLGHEDRGLALAARLAAQQAAAASRRPEARWQGLVYRAGGYAYGADTLISSIMESAGLDNVAARLGQRFAGTLDMEAVLVGAPQLLLEDQVHDRGDPRLATDLLAHPALKRGLPQTARIEFPMAFWLCGGPATPIAIDALSSLLDAHRSTQEGAR